MLISFIIPFYGSVPLLKRCLDSIAAQTDSDYEAIVVDDCSPDCAKDLLAQCDARFRYVIQPENQGPYQGRVRGVEEAKGEYVVDVDCDDYVKPELVTELRKAIERNHADIVIYNVEQDAEGTITPHWCRYEPGVYTSAEVMACLVEKKLQWNFWSKAIRRKIVLKTWQVVPDLRTTHVFAPDDFCATVPMILSSEKIEVVPYVGYRYWQGADSICRSITFKKVWRALQDTREARRLVLAFAERMNCPDAIRSQIKAMARMISGWWRSEYVHALKRMLRAPWLMVGAIVLLGSLADAAEIQKMVLSSNALQFDFPLTLVLPSDYAQTTNRYPVVYLLHGHGGSDQSFIRGDYRPIVSQAVDDYRIILVMPDGRADCWWIDSPVVRRSRYEYLVANEIVPFVDERIRTRANRRYRAIGGVSMGGFGSWWIGLRHKDIFGSVGSILGCVEIWMAPAQKGVERLLGPKLGNEARWKEYSIIEAAKTLKNGELDLISINGTKDFLISGNRQLHLRLSERGISHAYIELCGENDAYSSHTGAFASRAMGMMLFSMNRFFLTGKGTL